MHVRLFALLAVLFLLAADAKDDADKEMKKFEGNWVMTAGERDGQKLADEHVKASKIGWKGKEVTVVTPHQSKEPIKGACTIDPTKSPKEMDWVRSAGPDAGKTFRAIYEFTGPDEYRICFAPAGQDRPKTFTTKAGSGHTLHSWKRVKP